MQHKLSTKATDVHERECQSAHFKNSQVPQDSLVNTNEHAIFPKARNRKKWLLPSQNYWLLHCASEMGHDYTVCITLGHNNNIWTPENEWNCP